MKTDNKVQDIVTLYIPIWFYSNFANISEYFCANVSLHSNLVLFKYYSFYGFEVPKSTLHSNLVLFKLRVFGFASGV